MALTRKASTMNGFLPGPGCSCEGALADNLPRPRLLMGPLRSQSLCKAPRRVSSSARRSKNLCFSETHRVVPRAKRFVPEGSD